MLSRLEHSLGKNFWHVVSTDAKATIDTSGYYDLASDVLVIGDWMFTEASDGYGIAIITANSGGVVDATDVTAIGGSDTD
jgi:gentisate 1,2-dioxygenase